MYDYFTNVKGLHNLIWVWNGQNAQWYPGDDVVDIIGDDIYANPHDITPHVETFNTVQTWAPKQNKMVTLSECGVPPQPALCVTYQAPWSWFMVWNDGKMNAVTDSANFWGGSYYLTQAEKIKIYSDPLAITLERLPDITK
jgi:mannan endo-1,4-beta-mannosidase